MYHYVYSSEVGDLSECLVDNINDIIYIISVSGNDKNRLCMI